MAFGSIRQVSVWVDESAPRRGAFAQALELASGLALPLRAVIPVPEGLRRLPAEPESAVDRPIADLLAACRTACAARGVPLECSVSEGTAADGVRGFLCPSALCVFGSALADTAKVELVGQALGADDVPIFVCPQVPQLVSRVLVLHQTPEFAEGFLKSVAQWCGALQVAPVVLALAGKEREAAVLQDTAQQVWGTLGLAADFDVLVGCDVRTALASVARWRRCSHVIVPRQPPSPWWRWLRGDPLGRLLGLADSFGLLALPAVREHRTQAEQLLQPHVAGRA
jgi:hypothetical protein